jgi:serine/threonine protein phosphatase 1
MLVGGSNNNVFKEANRLTRILVMAQETYVIGDIHGALKALRQVISTCRPETNSKLVFLGDYVDGLPESAQVIDFMIELDQRFQCVFLKGNHDFWLQEWLETGCASPTWLSEGGLSTLRSYGSYNDQEKKQHRDFFRKLKSYHVDDAQNLFVHAGFTSLQGPAKEMSESYLFNDRTLLETAMIFKDLKTTQTIYYPTRLSLFHEIFIGHTPTLKFGFETPIHAANLWDLDTGVKKNGRLTIMHVKSKEFWQSDPMIDLYPEEGEKLFL